MNFQLYFFFTPFYNKNGGSMEKIKCYNKRLDLLRILFCTAVFLYHLGYLKGGYLAVCGFFVLSGYLSFTSASRKEKFSIVEYYKKRFFHIYLPLLIVVFGTIGVIFLFPSIHWLNLKPETTSVLLGYNNFWQLNASLDYFARHISSPFMHFWYIAILIQFDLLFPFLFLISKKIKDKSKITAGIILGFLALLSTTYFIYRGIKEENIMILYYHTINRIFSIFIGIFLGFLSNNTSPTIIKNIKIRNITFYIYLIMLILLFLFIDSSSPFFIAGMIVSSLLTARIICYTNMDEKREKLLPFFSSISYEIYLIQYPVIFLLQYFYQHSIYLSLSIICITILLSILLHIALNTKKKYIQIILLLIFGGISLLGSYHYITEKDYTEEMKQLEEQLNQNEQIMKEKQNQYAEKLKNEKDAYQESLKELEDNESNLEEIIHNLSVVGVGDSVMLGALSSLYEQFPNGYFDAQVSRTDYEANRILQSLKYQNMLGDPILINLGTNGQCGISCQNTILETIEDRKLFWINVVNDASVHVNEGLNRLAENNKNVFIIDWNQKSNGHPEYFAVDGIHLTGTGREVYSKFIYQNIYEKYLEDFQNRKKQILENHQENLNQKIAFYGKEILVNAYPYFEENITEFELNFHTTTEEDMEKLMEQILKDSSSDFFPKHTVIILDTIDDITKYYQKLEKIPSNIYLVHTNSIVYSNIENITLLNFYQEIQKHPEYLMIDRVHLTKEGNQALLEMILKNIKKEKSN